MPAINVNAIVEAVKRAGAVNVRIVPMPGQGVDGQQQIEVRTGSEWTVVCEGLSTRMANDLVSQATNRVILG